MKQIPVGPKGSEKSVFLLNVLVAPDSKMSKKKKFNNNFFLMQNDSGFYTCAFQPAKHCFSYIIHCKNWVCQHLETKWYL